ncbi:hypothetical protein JB92DRAFT_2976635 [Gautieria morchelliformis]|nr:hypothetical protein JB92DRAFT_2976635 [Gautieria morchelliformis]
MHVLRTRPFSPQTNRQPLHGRFSSRPHTRLLKMILSKPFVRNVPALQGVPLQPARKGRSRWRQTLQSCALSSVLLRLVYQRLLRLPQ